MKILATGLNGLIGSRLVELLTAHEFENVSRSSGVDMTIQAQITDVITKSQAPVVLHMAAKTDVDGCEKDRQAGEQGEAWVMNVTATQYIVDACKATGKKLIYVSTDFVFDGENTPESGYTEEEDPYPVNWYGQTKYRGEVVVQESGLEYIIVRPAYPYRVQFEPKKDFVRAMIARLEQKQPIMGVVDHIMCPVFIDDFVHALDTLLTQNAKGIYHTVGSEAISPYMAAMSIATELGLDTSLIQKTNRTDYFNGKAPRPFNLTLNSGKINALGVKLRSFQDGLQEFKPKPPKEEDSR